METHTKREHQTSRLEDLLYTQRNSGNYELSEEERESAITLAQIEKRKRIMEEEDRAHRARWEAELKREWKASEMLTYITWKASRTKRNFTIDSDNHNVIKALSLYTTRNQKFCSAGETFSLDKGIMLCGDCGTGKTSIMELFRANQRQSYAVISAREVADLYKIEGESIIHRFSKPLYVPADSSTFYQNRIGLCIDDLGSETSKSHYGPKVNVIEDIIRNRYDSKLPHFLTHVTTNLNPDEIEERYGKAVRSRMREMFNMMVLGGQDRRK